MTPSAVGHDRADQDCDRAAGDYADPFERAKPTAVRRAPRRRGDATSASLFFRGYFGPDQPGEPDKLLHNRRWRDPGAVRPEQPAGNHYQPRIGGGLDHRKPNRGKSQFHMHQIHFELLKRNGVRVPETDRQFLDVVEVPFWSATGPYPGARVRMDFRGMDIGDFVNHGHILGHEDNGMMAIIRVLPRS
jgi:Multicopper oxidase